MFYIEKEFDGEIWREYRIKVIDGEKVVVGNKGHYETDEEGNEVWTVDYTNGFTPVEGFLTEEEIEQLKNPPSEK